ncbi:hypothetical protein F2Q70_00034055 [Brassica cretica]|uniref:Uncharacterized protein n=2 Tax=Brassica cretica TaxID=69181 RepID=A0A8S9JVM7_BRACR|nr:hypothetical protein F2Q68_00028993 [Brassica cretica]KAF2586011.1 hypothetical protein F2Q70_00034055 [Brassica cretica]KAF3530646.1 hypothetical protein DY000_02036732 [Brassica cretica]
MKMKMMKQAQTILTKGAREGQACLGDAGQTSSGFSVCGWMVRESFHKYVLKRREDWYRVHKFVDDEKKRLEEKRARNEKDGQVIASLCFSLDEHDLVLCSGMFSYESDLNNKFVSHTSNPLRWKRHSGFDLELVLCSIPM